MMRILPTTLLQFLTSFDDLPDAPRDLCGRRIETERNRLRVCGNGLRVLALCRIRVAEEEMRVGIVPVQLDRLLQGFLNWSDDVRHRT